jgi:hypothetical protein
MKAGAEPITRVRLCVPQELPRIIYCDLAIFLKSPPLSPKKHSGNGNGTSIGILTRVDLYLIVRSGTRLSKRKIFKRAAYVRRRLLNTRHVRPPALQVGRGGAVSLCGRYAAVDLSSTLWRTISETGGFDFAKLLSDEAHS